jgi:trehalose-phosphatase
MKLLRQSLDLDSFFRALESAPRPLLMLDYDGTLAPFRVERDEAVPYPGIPELLTGLVEESRTRVVIISGRWSRDLIPLLDMSPLPEIWGCHGAERRFADGQRLPIDIPEATKVGLAAVRDWSHREKLSDRIEQKPTSVTFHWRGLSEQEQSTLRDHVLGRWEAELSGAGLEAHAFDGGLELRAAGINKGRAVARLLTEAPDAANAMAYLGDDLTDEDAFAAMRDRGLKVLVRPEYRETAADLWLEPPDELRDFLKRWLAATALH